MSEQRYELKPYGVRYLCECGKEMVYNGQMLMSNPPQYTHICECGNQENLIDKYPTVRWERLERGKRRTLDFLDE